MGSLKHTDDLFCDGAQQVVVKSHCSICHNKMKHPNKRTLGNCCVQCNHRANNVARGIMSEKESDFMLMYLMSDLQEERWSIDGVEYIKRPNGELYGI